MTQNKVNRKFNLLKFSALYGVAILLLGVLFAAFTDENPPVSGDTNKTVLSSGSAGNSTLAEIDRMLHSQFTALAEADKQDRQQNSAGNGVQSKEHQSVYAVELEKVIESRLDSIETNVSSLPDDSKGSLIDVIYHFRQILASRNERRTMKTPEIDSQPDGSDAQLQERVAELKQELVKKQEEVKVLGNRATGASPEQVRNLQQELEARNKRIAQLERQVSNPDNASLANAPAKGENLKDLQQRNANLKLAYSTTQTQLGVVAKELNILKRENQRLQSLVADQRRGSENQ
ncbi:MAG: hypothetical protein WKF70_09200 [Chitinophagaceae bacterium]